MFAYATYIKDPAALHDYRISWVHDDTLETGDRHPDLDWLGEDDLIDEAVWTVPEPLEIDQQVDDEETSTVWISGGVAGEDYEMACHITTAQGREDERTILLRCRNR